MKTTLDRDRANAALWSPERRFAALAECHRWHGTAHVNRIAVHGHGIDCIHLVQKIYEAARLLPPAKLGFYNTEAGLFQKSDAMERCLLEALHAFSTGPEDPRFGDIVVFQTGRTSAHCAFYSDQEVWHSLAKRCVIRSPWELWKHKAERLVRIYAPEYRDNPQIVIKAHGR